MAEAFMAVCLLSNAHIYEFTFTYPLASAWFFKIFFILADDPILPDLGLYSWMYKLTIHI